MDWQKTKAKTIRGAVQIGLRLWVAVPLAVGGALLPLGNYAGAALAALAALNAAVAWWSLKESADTHGRAQAAEKLLEAMLNGHVQAVISRMEISGSAKEQHPITH